MVEVQEDFVMQRIIREEGVRLVEHVDDLEILQAAWIVLHKGEVACPTADQLKPALQEVFMTVKPYPLAYEGWRTLQDYIDPPKPPSPELERIARTMDSFFGIQPAHKRRIEG